MVDTFGGAFPDHGILLAEKYGITDTLPCNDRDGERTDCPAETRPNDALSVRVSDYTAVPDLAADAECGGEPGRDIQNR